MNFLLKRGEIQPGSEIFGKAFEHFIYQEIAAYSHYSRLHFPLAYWRTSSQLEIDFVLGDHEVAVEVKSSKMALDRHFKGLRAFKEEYRPKRSILVSFDSAARVADGVEVLPWKIFLEKLWAGGIIS